MYFYAFFFWLCKKKNLVLISSSRLINNACNNWLEERFVLFTQLPNDPFMRSLEGQSCPKSKCKKETTTPTQTHYSTQILHQPKKKLFFLFISSSVFFSFTVFVVIQPIYERLADSLKLLQKRTFFFFVWIAFLTLFIRKKGLFSKITVQRSQASFEIS